MLQTIAKATSAQSAITKTFAHTLLGLNRLAMRLRLRLSRAFVVTQGIVASLSSIADEVKVSDPDDQFPDSVECATLLGVTEQTTGKKPFSPGVSAGSRADPRGSTAPNTRRGVRMAAPNWRLGRPSANQMSAKVEVLGISLGDSRFL